MSVGYRLDLSQTRTHRLGVEVEAQRDSLDPLDFVLPQLSPGSPTNSLNHPSRILGVSACDAEGEPAELEKLGPGHFRIHSEISGPLTLRYTIKADEFSHVRSYLSEDLAYINGPSALACVAGRENQPSTVQLTGIPSQSWRISSTLESWPECPNTFLAPTYADIADSNLLAGDFQQVSAQVGETLLQVNQNGRPPWPNLPINGATPEESLQDLTKLYETFMDEFGPFPRQREWGQSPTTSVQGTDKYVVTKHYLHGNGPAAGGYEHYHGQELLLHKRAEPSILRRFDGDGRAHERHIMAHELMHKLMAKFVRHQGIDSADLTHIGCSDGLWLTEGGVEWAAMALQRKSGHFSEGQYVKMLGELFTSYSQAYAQDPSNARDNSLDAHLGNGGYYNKGATTCALLDLELKAASDGKKGMFDVFRQLKDEFGGNGKFWELPDVERICRQLVGDSVQPFFDKYLHDRQPFDFEGILAKVGMTFTPRPDRWAPAELALGGQSLGSDASGQLQLGPALAGNDKPVVLPGLGLTLSSNSKGEVKLVAVRSGSQAESLGLADFTGQTSTRFEPKADEQGRVTEVHLEFSRTHPFTGEKQTPGYDLRPQPASQLLFEDLAEAAPRNRDLRQAWLAGATPK